MSKHKVHFFKINTKDGHLDDGLSFKNTCHEVYGQTITEKSVDQTDGSTYRLTHLEIHNDHIEGKIVKYKTGTMITGTENDDVLTDLTLEDGKRFAEVTHFIYSPATGILCFEYNQSGPRYSMFIRYINAIQARIRSDVTFYIADPLFHPDTLQKLDSAREIKAVKIKIPTAKIPTDSDHNVLLQGLRAASRFGNPGQIELIIKGTRGRGDQTPLMSTDSLMTSIRNHTIDADIFGSVDIDIATDYGAETVNLLENRFESSKEWTVPITSENAQRWFSDILGFYQTNKEALLIAAANLRAE